MRQKILRKVDFVIDAFSILFLLLGGVTYGLLIYSGINPIAIIGPRFYSIANTSLRFSALFGVLSFSLVVLHVLAESHISRVLKEMR